MDYVAICRHVTAMINRALSRGQDEFAWEPMDARSTFAHHQTLQDREGFEYLHSLQEPTQ